MTEIVRDESGRFYFSLQVEKISMEELHVMPLDCFKIVMKVIIKEMTKLKEEQQI